MTRTGRAPTSHHASRLAAVVMLLLALGAAVLVSAGSAHHQPGPAAALAVEVGDVAMTNPLSAHEHHHGNEWAPTLNKRLRPAATVAFVGVVTIGPGSAEPPSAVPASTGDGLALLGVLRV